MQVIYDHNKDSILFDSINDKYALELTKTLLLHNKINYEEIGSIDASNRTKRLDVFDFNEYDLDELVVKIKQLLASKKIKNMPVLGKVKDRPYSLPLDLITDKQEDLAGLISKLIELKNEYKHLINIDVKNKMIYVDNRNNELVTKVKKLWNKYNK